MTVTPQRPEPVRRAAPTRLHGLCDAVRRPGTGRSIATTAAFNMVATAAAGVGGIILARTVGPTVRGEYAAIWAWVGVALTIGEVGQPAALCFYVARDPERARAYVATSRAMMLMTGVLTLATGMVLAPLLAHGIAAVTLGYRIAFASCVVAFISASYTFSLQARDLRRWNIVQVTQPILSVFAIVALWRLHLLSLDAAIIVFAVTDLLQLLWAYRCCRRANLAPGRAQRALLRPLATYGMAQIAAAAPALVNVQFDQLVLSQTAPAAELGRYAIAVSLTLVPVPLISAIGNVAFPRLAAQRAMTTGTHRLQRTAVLASAGGAVAILAPLAAVAYWLVPLVFGAAYRGAVPLLWLLTPGAIFLACGKVTGDLLRGTNRPSIVARAQGLAAVCTVVLLVALLPVMGVAAAAIASTIAYGVALTVMLRQLWRGQPWPSRT